MTTILEYILINYPIIQGIKKDWIVAGMAGITGMVFLCLICFMGIFLGWLDRKTSARFQRRTGPEGRGITKGYLRIIADWIKLLSKENPTPPGSDGMLFKVAPFLAFVPSFAVLAALPLGPRLVAADISIGIIYILALVAVGSLCSISAGLASGNIYSLYGTVRAAAQLASFMVPLVLSTIPVIMVAETFNMKEIVHCQTGGIQNWFIFQSFPFNLFGAIVFFAAAMAIIRMNPFSAPHAGPDVAGGPYFEYGGIRLGISFLAGYSNLFILASTLSILYFGGWEPFLPSLSPIPGVVWILLKSLVIIFAQLWIHRTLPGLRIDTITVESWKILFGLSCVGIVGTGIYCVI